MNKASRYIYTAPISPYLLHKLFRGKWLCAKKWSPYKLLFHLIHIRGESFPLSNFGFPFFLKRVFLFHESWITFQTNNEAMNEYLLISPLCHLLNESKRCTAWSNFFNMGGRVMFLDSVFNFDPHSSFGKQWRTFYVWNHFVNCFITRQQLVVVNQSNHRYFQLQQCKSLSNTVSGSMSCNSSSLIS